MSRFFSSKYSSLVPYEPGEQPCDMKYIKLNTNESPFPPSEKAIKYAALAARQLELYPDPECRELNEKFARICGVEPDEVMAVNGSDEMLNFAFMAFCDDKCLAAFADITYGFYPVFAELNLVPYTTIPLKDDFTIDIESFEGINKTIFIANPNAPTGIALKVKELERVISGNPDNVVVIDEAYVDFGTESCVSLIHKYDNLLVTQTFSKSRSMAGARLGFGIGNKSLIQDLNTVRYSTNPYNINRMTMAAGIGALEDEQYTRENCRIICSNREFTAAKLREYGFTVIDSDTNFIFVKHPELSGSYIYSELKKRGILVRHFESDRIKDYNRITIGSREQMETLIKTIGEILQ